MHKRIKNYIIDDDGLLKYTVNVSPNFYNLFKKNVIISNLDGT